MLTALLSNFKNRALFVLLSLLSLACRAEPSWKFISVSETLRGDTDWQVSRGVATVQMNNGRIKIEVFELPAPQPSAPQFKEPLLIIEGSLDERGAIVATGARTHTGERPFKLNGTLTTWRREENWAGRKVQVTFRDIIFPLHPHYEQYALVSKTVEGN